MKKYRFQIALVSLIIVLVVVAFYVFYVHIPYYDYHHNLDLIRNEICEKNNYNYDDYFYEHHGRELYYIMKIKANGDEYYVAYNEDKELVDRIKEPFAKEADVIAAINEKYDIEFDNLEVGYENNKFVYCQKYLESSKLTYIYYYLDTGEFMKAYIIED